MSQAEEQVNSVAASVNSTPESKFSVAESTTPLTLSQESDLAKGQTFAISTPIQHKRLNQLQKLGGKSPGSPPVLKIPASPMMTRLGYGTGVGVYLIERSPKPTGEIRSPWAIKKITALKNSNNKIYLARLEYEAGILKQLDHPNIIGYRTFSMSAGIGGPFLAMETASKSLSDLIESRLDDIMLSVEMNPNPFPAKNMEKVGLDIAKALEYLHEVKKMIHGDIKSGNVLIFGDFEIVKLCDFGVARKLKEDGTLEGFYVGTEIWNPQEVMLALKGDGDGPSSITHKADMYPFGLTLYEMLSLKPPHLSTDVDGDAESLDSSYVESGTDNDTNDSFDESLYEERLAERIGTRPSLPDIEFDDSYNRILEIFYCCTEEDPLKRPNASHIVGLLQPKDLENSAA